MLGKHPASYLYSHIPQFLSLTSPSMKSSKPFHWNTIETLLDVMTFTFDHVDLWIWSTKLTWISLQGAGIRWQRVQEPEGRGGRMTLKCHINICRPRDLDLWPWSINLTWICYWDTEFRGCREHTAKGRGSRYSLFSQLTPANPGKQGSISRQMKGSREQREQRE